jgi:hypothetical protein
LRHKANPVLLNVLSMTIQRRQAWEPGDNRRLTAALQMAYR